MQVLLDTNVLLDSLLQRTPWHGDSAARAACLKIAAHCAVCGRIRRRKPRRLIGAPASAMMNSSGGAGVGMTAATSDVAC